MIMRLLGADKFINRFNRAMKDSPTMLSDAMNKTMFKLRDYVKTQKLTGQVLKNRTGTLRRSIVASVKQTGESVEGRVGTNLSYARTHELGLTIPAREVWATRRKALSFLWGGKKVAFRHVSIPAVKMPFRPFLKPSLNENRQMIRDTLKDAMKATFKK